MAVEWLRLQHGFQQFGLDFSGWNDFFHDFGHGLSGPVWVSEVARHMLLCAAIFLVALADERCQSLYQSKSENIGILPCENGQASCLAVWNQVENLRFTTWQLGSIWSVAPARFSSSKDHLFIICFSAVVVKSSKLTKNQCPIVGGIWTSLKFPRSFCSHTFAQQLGLQMCRISVVIYLVVASSCQVGLLCTCLAYLTVLWIWVEISLMRSLPWASVSPVTRTTGAPLTFTVSKAHKLFSAEMLELFVRIGRCNGWTCCLYWVWQAVQGYNGRNWLIEVISESDSKPSEDNEVAFPCVSNPIWSLEHLPSSQFGNFASLRASSSNAASPKQLPQRWFKGCWLHHNSKLHGSLEKNYEHLLNFAIRHVICGRRVDLAPPSSRRPRP